MKKEARDVAGVQWTPLRSRSNDRGGSREGSNDKEKIRVNGSQSLYLSMFSLDHDEKRTC